MLMSGIVKALRGNANKDRIEILGLHHKLHQSSAERMQHLQDDAIIDTTVLIPDI